MLHSPATATTAVFARYSLDQTGHEAREQSVPISPPSRMPWSAFAAHLRQAKPRQAVTQQSAKEKASGKNGASKRVARATARHMADGAGEKRGGTRGEEKDTTSAGSYCLSQLEIAARGVRTDGKGAEMIGREGMDQLVQHTEEALQGPAMAPLLSQLGLWQSETIDVRPCETRNFRDQPMC